MLLSAVVTGIGLVDSLMKRLAVVIGESKSDLVGTLDSGVVSSEESNES